MEVPEFTLSNSMKIPALGLGTWNLNGKKCIEAVSTAIRLGYRHIDTAEIYMNHKAVAQGIIESNTKREELFITSKVWHSNLHYKGVISSCEKTLNELQIKYLDLYLIHWPNRSIPFQETIEALEKLVDENNIRSYGVSNFTIRHIKDVLILSKKPIVANQVEFHPLLYQKELLEFCRTKEISVIAYSPLAHGHIFKNNMINEIAQEYGKNAGQISLRWLFQKNIISIPKASSEAHLRENLEIFDFQLKEKDVERIDSIGMVKRVINPLFLSDFKYR